MTYLVPRHNWPQRRRSIFNDNFFSDFFSPHSTWTNTGGHTSFLSAVDIEEGEKSYTLSMDLPGVSKEDVSISLDSNVLTISGERKHESESEGGYRKERYFGNFERSFRLGNTVDPSAINAKMANGVLTVTLEKKEEATPKQIPVVSQ